MLQSRLCAYPWYKHKYNGPQDSFQELPRLNHPHPIAQALLTPIFYGLSFSLPQAFINMEIPCS
uniref:Uncharacterized protein n=1 Tax=Nelumbo nucifera TaxID=4432 RepID=A0A822XPY6_NELNU|nr:TPA_asm: hypothetical protein HUJ06_023565 [Nelumbo nucifera]